ncbi:MAG: hypothetical protein ACOCV2_15555, partial [Persicimonas sp.]
MAQPTTILGQLKWDLLLVALLGAVAVVVALDDNPTTRHEESPTSEGDRPPDRSEGDILLLLPDSPGAEAKDFSELDCSYGWFNSLWQYAGSFASALTQDLNPQMLAGRSAVIVPRRVARAMPQNGIDALEDFARDGGQVLVEHPGEGWDVLTDIESGEAPPARAVTSTEGIAAGGLHARSAPLDELPEAPLSGALLPTASAEPYPTGPTLLEVDGQPGLTVQEVGDGHFYTFLFDFGCSTTGIQQGRPTEKMRFGRDPQRDELPVDERVADRRLLEADAPYADLLERAVFDRLSQVRPIPRLWGFPGEHDGALMLTHPTPTNPRAAIGYADYARKKDVSSTVFAAADLVTQNEAALLDQTGADIGLLWVGGYERPAIREGLGIGAFTPIERELSLAEQHALLQSTLEGVSDHRVDFGRVEASTWQNDWETTFGQLAKAGLRLDNSFGPTREDHFGYLFGTGYPYYPIDDHGLPFPMLEAPFVLQGANASFERLQRLLADSEAVYHQSLVVSLPSDAMRTEPSAGILLTFRSAVEEAGKHDHWVTSLSEFYEFLSARRGSVLESEWSDEQYRLSISAELQGASVESLDGDATPSIVVPSTFDGREIERVVVDDEPVDEGRMSTTESGRERRLALDPG